MIPLPPAFTATRESLRAVACYVIAPARKAETGRIGLVSTGDGFGTPPLAGGRRVLVRGDLLVVEPGAGRPLTTVRDAAEQVGVELSPDPGVGHDLPPFEPDTPLAVDAAASLAMGRWYALGDAALTRLVEGDRLPAGASTSEVQLWPEHFDLALVVMLAGGAAVNVGFSPGDAGVEEPYVYVGPHDLDGLRGGYWNAPFGAVLRRSELRGDDESAEAETAALEFVAEGLSLLDPPP